LCRRAGRAGEGEARPVGAAGPHARGKDQFQRDKLQTEYDAGGDVDYNKLAMLDTAAKAAEAELDSTVRSAHADNAAIETLRGRLTDAHAALCIAMAPQVDRARAVARAKYAAGLQEIRDAVVILGRTDDEMLPLRMKIPDIEPGGFAFGRVTPSPDVVDLLLEFDAGIRERDVALRAMIR
jgi:hypothetical protein